MTFIILEGTDGAGKTTLAEAVRQELVRRFPNDKVEYRHASQLTRDPLDEYALDIELYWPGQGKHIIADRWHWGETIYGPLYRDESALTTAGFRWVELFLAARGATTWHVSASLETIQKRLAVRGEDYLQSHHVEHVWRSFQDVADRALTAGDQTCWTDITPTDELVERIVEQAIYQETQASGVDRLEYVGRHLPHTLLVGDKQGGSEPGATAAPFMPRGKSSGTFLLEALPDIWWHGVGIVNAYETDLIALWRELLEPNVVALGAKASKRLSDLGIDHAAVPHPQKVRRFYHAKRDEYGTLIRDISMKGGSQLSWPKS